MPNMKSLSLTVQKFWPRLKFLPQSNRQTGQKLDAPEFHSKAYKLWFHSIELTPVENISGSIKEFAKGAITSSITWQSNIVSGDGLT